MSKMKRVFKIGILFILFVILAFIVSLLIFFVLDKYNLFDNKITKLISTLFSVIIGIGVVQFLIKRID